MQLVPAEIVTRTILWTVPKATPSLVFVAALLVRKCFKLQRYFSNAEQCASK